MKKYWFSYVGSPYLVWTMVGKKKEPMKLNHRQFKVLRESLLKA